MDEDVSFSDLEDDDDECSKEEVLYLNPQI